jgi:glucose/arabinose dehydrogenase
MAGGPVSAQPSAAPPEAPQADAAVSAGQVRLRHISGGLASPLGVVNAGDGTNRLFVLEKRGTVRVVKNDKLQSGFFLDIRGVAGGLTTSGERGLLGLAFHPDFESNRKLFVNYTNGAGDTVIAEFTANSNRTSVPQSSRKVLTNSTYGNLVIDQPYSNHNGGQLLFGPDGHLYIFTGDGGSAGDPQNRAQNNGSKLGKILRITPNLNGGYTVPSDNPFFGGSPSNDLVWANGLRNPWRASFDTGASPDRLWIADVGQGSWEEVNRVNATSKPINYGWRCREGYATYNTDGNACTGLTNPIEAYGHGSGDCSVTGGVVYRGPIFRELVGHYVFGDFCSGRIWTLNAGQADPARVLHRDTSAMITSFGAAENGELYMTDYGAGVLYRVVAPQFSDVTTSGFINDITWLGYEGITSGCGGGRFCPKGEVARDQMASFIARALNLPRASRDYFTDDNGNKHEANINRIAAAGITFGCGERRYCPSGLVARDQMASFIARALKLPRATRDWYTDDEGNRHEENINRFADAGITRGCTARTFCPKGLTLREQMAAFLRRAFPNR